MSGLRAWVVAPHSKGAGQLSPWGLRCCGALHGNARSSWVWPLMHACPSHIAGMIARPVFPRVCAYTLPPTAPNLHPGPPQTPRTTSAPTTCEPSLPSANGTLTHQQDHNNTRLFQSSLSFHNLGHHGGHGGWRLRAAPESLCRRAVGARKAHGPHTAPPTCGAWLLTARTDAFARMLCTCACA